LLLRLKSQGEIERVKLNGREEQKPDSEEKSAANESTRTARGGDQKKSSREGAEGNG